MIEEILAEDGARDSGSSAGLAYAGGAIVGWHTEHGARTMKRLTKRWKRFTQLKPFWR